MQGCVAKFDGAGLYKPGDPVRNIGVGCMLHHRPSLACGFWHPTCPFKCSTCRFSHSGTQEVDRIHVAGRERVSSFCYCGSEKFFQHLAAL